MLPKPRSPNRDLAYEIYKEHGGNIELRRIAERIVISEKTISGWKCKDKWDQQLNGVLQTDERSTPKTSKRNKGAPKGNKNAVGNAGGSAPPKNKNAEKHGFFSKWLPAETLEIMESIEQSSPIDLLWDQIMIQYTAIIRAQQIMYVDSKNEMIKELKKSKSSEFGSEESYEFQFAWDRQATFLNAQSRAMTTLNGMIKQYEEMLNSDLATEEQKARIDKLKVEISKAKDGDQEEYDDDGFIEALDGKLHEVWDDEEASTV